MPLVYLDAHASTAVDPRVASRVVDSMRVDFANALSTSHQMGQRANDDVGGARAALASLIGSMPENVCFTSGASEAIRLAVAIAAERTPDRPMRVGATRVEHRALLDELELRARRGLVHIVWIDVDEHARVAPHSFTNVLQSGVDLVCTIAGSNEVGTLNPIQQLAAEARSYDVPVLVDATQAVGATRLHSDEWGIDYLALSAHKIYGPKGVGALIGPGVETEIRGIYGHVGTPNVPGIVGLGEACRILATEMDHDRVNISSLRDSLQSKLLDALPGVVINGDLANRLPGNLHFSALGADNDLVVARLANTVAISTGAACSSGAMAPSHVLVAMGLSEDRQDSALRIGVGRFNTVDEIDLAADAIIDAVRYARNASGWHK